MTTVRSFDVFDTVITRTLGDPDSVIDLLGDRLEEAGLIPVSRVVFAEARKRHERRLNRLTRGHVPLHRIHAEIAAVFSVSPSEGASWALAEETLERELVVPVPGAAQLVGSARESGHQVIFVSDTPHSEQFVRELLTIHGLAQDDDLVFTSSERGATKSQGGLFDVVSATLGPGHHVLHTGDNRRSDLASPRLEGWEGRLAPDAQLSRYERLLEGHSAQTARVTSWLAGASRLARLEAQHRGVAAPVASIASGSMAPLLIGYALWLIGQARLRGIRRLYFVARDGEIMLRVARHVFGQLAPDLELRYLHGSRQPWVFGACATSDLLLSHWAVGRTDFTARTTLGRLSLTPEQVFDITGLACAGPARADTPLSAEERRELAEHIQREPLVSLVRDAASAFARRATAYFRQEGLVDGVPSALVDAGWSGRAAAGFDQLLAEAGGQPVTHFFVGLLGSADEAQIRRHVRLVPWLFDRQQHADSLAGLHSPNVLVEMLCAGTTGRTIDYTVDEVSGLVKPVLDTELNEPALTWGLREVQRTAVRVAEIAAPNLPAAAVNIDSTGYVWDVLSAFWTHPTKAEVRAWGTFPGEEEIWPPFMPLAQRVTAKSMVERVLRGERTLRRNNTWRAGSALASNQPWRGLLQARAWTEENRQRIRRIPRRLRLGLASRRSR